MAIDSPEKKYGNTQLILNELVEQMERCQASSRKTEDQRNLDTFYKRSMSNPMREVGPQDHYIQASAISLIRKWNINITSNSIRKEKACIFCEKKGHSPRSCPEFTTHEQRLQYMRRHSLCLNCGAPDHRANECNKGPPAEFSFLLIKTRRIHILLTQTRRRRKIRSRRIMFGKYQFENKAKGLCPHRRGAGLQQIHTDRSSVCNELARRLCLENEDSIRMSINTFGNHAPGETLCDAHYNPKI
ncbi:zinc knuckle [Cooperia oncophora]